MTYSCFHVAFTSLGDHANGIVVLVFDFSKKRGCW